MDDKINYGFKYGYKNSIIILIVFNKYKYLRQILAKTTAITTAKLIPIILHVFNLLSELVSP